MTTQVLLVALVTGGLTLVGVLLTGRQALKIVGRQIAAETDRAREQRAAEREQERQAEVGRLVADFFVAADTFAAPALMWVEVTPPPGGREALGSFPTFGGPEAMARGLIEAKRLHWRLWVRASRPIAEAASEYYDLMTRLHRQVRERHAEAEEAGEQYFDPGPHPPGWRTTHLTLVNVARAELGPLAKRLEAEAQERS